MNPTTKELQEFKAFRAEIIQYGLLVAVLIEIGSFPFLGWDSKFAVGLFFGTATAVINLFLLSLTITKAVEKPNGAILTFTGYMIRLTIYGAVFFFSIREGLTSGLATLLGFMTVKMGILLVHGLKLKLRSRATK